MDNKPRLLFLVNIPRFFVSHRLPLAKAAREAGYDVHVATSKYDEANVQVIKEEGFAFHPLPLHQHGTNIFGELRTLIAIYKLFRTLKPTLVHQVTIKPVIYGGIAARITRTPAVVNAITGLGYFAESGFKASILRKIARLAYRIALSHPNMRMILQNKDDQAMFIQSGLLTPSKTVLIQGSGVDMEIFTPQPEPDETPIVLFAGRLLWKKGIGDFAEAARKLKSENIPARFVVVGYAEPGNPSAVQPDQLAEWDQEGILEWWGKRTDMPAVFAQSHIVCLPSTYGEGIPKVLIEAAACGRAIITTDTPGCREITLNGDNGLLVRGGDVDALATAIRTLVEDQGLRQKMGARGREIAQESFSIDHVIQSTMAVYDELLANAKS